jgi:hypothetical protein
MATDSDERLTRMEKQLAELTLMMAQLGTRSANDPSPTPSTLGKTAISQLRGYGGYCLVGCEEYRSHFPGAQAAPFLDGAQMQELKNKQFGDDESKLIQFFQPYFHALMTGASNELGFKVVLLNSERHAWTKCPKGGAATIPDGVALPVEFAHFQVGDKDNEYKNEGDDHFGKLANWVLRDSIEFIAEWKTGSNFARGLGEAIEYHLRINSRFDHDRQVQESKRTTDCFVGNEQGFYLARCIDGSPRSVFASDWNSQYSMDALHRFALGTLWPIMPRGRIWKHALTEACQELHVELLESSMEKDCFLGYGSDGRVFRVRNQNGDELAMKITVGDLSSAHAEINAMNAFRCRLEQTGVTVCLVSKVVRRGKNYAALLISPVGRSLRQLKKDVSVALASLRGLHVAGFSHGDARWKNAIILPDGTCRWIDLRSLVDISDESEDQKDFDFHYDVSTFIKSYGVKIDLASSLTSEYLKSNDATSMLEEISPIWRKGNASEPGDLVGLP